LRRGSSQRVSEIRGEQLEVSEVAVQDGEIFHILLVELHGDVRAVGLDLRNFATDFYRLRYRAQFEFGVNADSSVRRDEDILDLKGLERGGLDSHDVRVGNKVSDRIVATLVGSGLVGGAFGSGSHCDFSARNGATLGVIHSADNAALYSLRGCSGCAKAESQTKYRKPAE
jgi:hypothetical protein